jgi:hypothetical protein
VYEIITGSVARHNFGARENLRADCMSVMIGRRVNAVSEGLGCRDPIIWYARGAKYVSYVR